MTDPFGGSTAQPEATACGCSMLRFAQGPQASYERRSFID